MSHIAPVVRAEISASCSGVGPSGSNDASFTGGASRNAVAIASALACLCDSAADVDLVRASGGLMGPYGVSPTSGIAAKNLNQ